MPSYNSFRSVQPASCLASFVCILVVQYGMTASVNSMGPNNNTSYVTVSGIKSHQPSKDQQRLPTLSDAGTYEIRTVSGEPSYKSINLTWEVEFVPAANESDNVPPPKSFQIFYCEMQTFGPHRCRSKVVDDIDLIKSPEQIKHYTTRIENLRMATKYSFHIKPQKKKVLKITGRSELIDNTIENDLVQGQSIIIPTKGFSAQATKCLPHASEIEVETGPNFGGKIVVDGSNCGIKGNPNDATDRYVMRIDHKMCGSLVKPETNTVETFITVQENLGIFTHSTRRFLVVCSFQSGMQTVRASFTVPGKGGIAAPVENDPFEPDRAGRSYSPMKFVDKTRLILREEKASAINEISDNTPPLGIIENVVPSFSENEVKQETRAYSGEQQSRPLKIHRQAKYAKLVSESDPLEDVTLNPAQLNHIVGNVGNIVLTISLSVIMVGIFVYVLFRETRRKSMVHNNIQQIPNKK